MPYRIRPEEFDKTLYLEMAKAWLVCEPNMPDGYRDDRNFDIAFHNDAIPWYRGPLGSFIWLEAVVDRQATFHLLNPNGPGIIRETKVFHNIFREIFHDLNLKRINLILPSKVETIRKGAEKIGFVQEGVMRESLIFDGEWTDAVIYGLLYGDLPEKEKRKRTRKRRKRPVGKARVKAKEKKG